MTLADFARQIGISPSTARQWKKRGKIVETQAGYALRDGATLTVDDVTAIERDGVVVPKRDEMRPALTLPPLAEGQSHWTVASAPLSDSAQDSRSREGADLPLESHRGSCADAEGVRTMPDFTENTGTPPSWLKSSNFSGSRNELGEPYFD